MIGISIFGSNRKNLKSLGYQTQTTIDNTKTNSNLSDPLSKQQIEHRKNDPTISLSDDLGVSSSSSSSSSGFKTPTLDPSTINRKRTTVIFGSSQNLRSGTRKMDPGHLLEDLSTESTQHMSKDDILAKNKSVVNSNVKNIGLKKYGGNNMGHAGFGIPKNEDREKCARVSLFQSLGFDKKELIKSKTNLSLKNSMKTILETSVSYDGNKITGSYSIDLNIYSIDKYVIKNIKDKTSIELKTLLQNKEILLSEIRKPQTKIDRYNCKDEIDSINKKMKNMKNTQELVSYKDRTKVWLDAYTKLGSSNKVVVFNELKNRDIHDLPNEEDEIRSFIIRKYLSIAGDYTSINLIKQESLVNRCDQCNEKISLSDPNEDGNIFCLCGKKYETYNHSYQDDDDYQYASKGNNLDIFINNMKDVIKKYKGDHIPKLPTNWIKRLDKYFENHPKKIPLVNVKNKSHISDGDYVKVMLEALSNKDVNMSKHYDDVHYICYAYLDLELPDIDDIINPILEDCRKIYQIYIDNKGERKSNMGYWYLLWRCLDRRSAKCSPNDFKIVSTEEILDWYEKMWRLFCNELKWDQPISIQKKMISKMR